jgi:enoyl-CoA hydratase/carnithine racemase
VAHLQLCRPERLNTMAPPFFPALRDAVQALNTSGQTRALVISSTGKHFCAGMALDVFATESLALANARERLAFQDWLRQLMHCFDVLEQARFPVIAAIQGGCIGGALDLATACDLRVCSADAFFTVQEIHIGMAADLGVLQRLPKIVPPAVAREMAYTGDRVGAERALAIGLVNAVLPDAEATLATPGAGRPHRGQVATGHRRHQGGAELRGGPPHGRGAAADDAAAKRHLRHWRNGHGHHRLEGQGRRGICAAGRHAAAVERHSAGLGHAEDVELVAVQIAKVAGIEAVTARAGRAFVLRAQRHRLV